MKQSFHPTIAPSYRRTVVKDSHQLPAREYRHRRSEIRARELKRELMEDASEAIRDAVRSVELYIDMGM